MIALLQGTVMKLTSEEVIITVSGVGYRVFVPINVWDELNDGEESALHISTYVREERLDLYGFLDNAGRVLFEKFIDMSGIGPRTGLELSAVPKSLLMQAIGAQDAKLLTNVKGIGKKTAEKLLVDLKSLAEKQPEIFGSANTVSAAHTFDDDAIAGLKNLGYDTQTILNVLKDLPADLETTEQRITAALKNL